MSSAPESVLIVRLSSIGDVIHSLPAYEAVRAAWPEARLGWVSEPAAAPLLRRIVALVRGDALYRTITGMTHLLGLCVLILALWLASEIIVRDM